MVARWRVADVLDELGVRLDCLLILVRGTLVEDDSAVVTGSGGAVGPLVADGDSVDGLVQRDALLELLDP